MKRSDALRAGASALYAVGEALHGAARSHPRTLLRHLSRRYDVVDSVIHQIGAEEFHRLLLALTDEVGAFVREQAEQATTLVDEQHAFAQEIVRELGGMTDPSVVRRDCAFCRRERSAADDNHADSCPYWRIGPGAVR